MGEATKDGNLEIDIPMEEGEPLGATPNDKLIITKVQPGTLAEGKLRIGDQILKINNVAIQDTNHFFKLLRYAPPNAHLLVSRDSKRAEELEAKVHIPADRAKLIQRRDGFLYQLVKIEWKPGGPKLGLGIKHYQNRVLVSRADPGSLAASQLAVGDHIIDIDGKPVTDKDVARELLLKALQTTGCVSSVVERPESMEAKHWVQTALAATAAQPPSVAMNSDVRDIAARERQRLKAKSEQPKKQGILGRNTTPRKVAIQDKVINEHVIASDNEGKTLRPVRK
uniref:PDZ domain-containing protein n=1 Tax=Steinernema glaseri TaxID=37863 RepID=A0A1I8A5T3_9BILA